MISTEDIVALLRESTRFHGIITPETTLQNDLGIWGDDMDEVLGDYAKRFSVDMSSYLWYFHTGEEGQNLGSLFFKPPNARVLQIPITVCMLRDFANSGRWSVIYPEHTLPKHRVDITINRIIAVALLGVLATWLLAKWLK